MSTFDSSQFSNSTLTVRVAGDKQVLGAGGGKAGKGSVLDDVPGPGQSTVSVAKETAPGLAAASAVEGAPILVAAGAAKKAAPIFRGGLVS